MWYAAAGIGLANNLDNIGVGLAFGVGRVRISTGVNLWIAAITFAVTAASVAIGDRLAASLPAGVPHYVSAAVLCAMGLWMLAAYLPRPRRHSASQCDGTLGAILADPTCADQDRSRSIDFREATLLGVALCLNNVGGGFGAGLIRISLFWTAFWSGAFSFLALWLGGAAGLRVGAAFAGRYAQAAAGALLVAIGLYQLH